MSDRIGGGPGSPRTFHLDKRRGKLAGVCAGIADYFAVDVTLVRVLFVVGTLVGVGALLLAYLVIWLLAR